MSFKADTRSATTISSIYFIHYNFLCQKEHSVLSHQNFHLAVAPPLPPPPQIPSKTKAISSKSYIFFFLNVLFVLPLLESHSSSESNIGYLNWYNFDSFDKERVNTMSKFNTSPLFLYERLPVHAVR